MNPLYLALVYTVWLLITFFFLASMLTYLKNHRKFYVQPKNSILASPPAVSIIVPAFNEGKTISDTIKSLQKIDYPKDKLDIVVINDGSKDDTAEIAQKHADAGEIIFLNKEKNEGKAQALNDGFKMAKTDYVACMDADTIVDSNVLRETLPYFSNEKIAAVVARIKVWDPRNWLQKIIEVEYNLGLGFFPKIFSYIDCLYLTPGQFSIYRRQAVLDVGGFDPKNIVEDTEIAYRMQKKQMRIESCITTSAKTKVPDNLKDLYYQRKRWYAGTLQTILQHKDVFFNKNLGNFGLFFMPFNYGTVFFALMLFILTIYLTVKATYLTLSKLLLIGFDFLPVIQNAIKYFDFDPLTIGVWIFFAVTPFFMNAIACYLGMKAMGEKIRKNLFGFISFLFFFIPYHIFWIISIYFVARGEEVKWRASM